MNKNTSVILISVVIVFLLLGGGFLYIWSSSKNLGGVNQNQSTGANQQTPSPTVATGFTLILELAQAMPNANWQPTKPGTENIDGKEREGTVQTGNVVTKLGTLNMVGNQDAIEAAGWKEDINLEAGGPNGGGWGFRKTLPDGKQQVLYLSFRNNSFVPPPDETKCPCDMTLTAFLSEPF